VRGWLLRAATVALVVLLAGLLGGCGSSGPVVTYDGIGASYCLSPQTQRTQDGFTVGVGTVADSASSPVTFTSVKAVGARGTALVDAVIVPYKGGDAVGTGGGVASAPHNEAASLVPQLWKQRRFIPGAVLPAKGSPKAFQGWQVVFGIRRLGTSRAVLKSAKLTYRIGSRTYSLVVAVNVTYAPLTDTSRGGCPQ
jgi:hypothetical protein